MVQHTHTNYCSEVADRICSLWLSVLCSSVVYCYKKGDVIHRTILWWLSVILQPMNQGSIKKKNEAFFMSRRMGKWAGSSKQSIKNTDKLYGPNICCICCRYGSSCVFLMRCSRLCTDFHLLCPQGTKRVLKSNKVTSGWHNCSFSKWAQMSLKK